MQHNRNECISQKQTDKRTANLSNNSAFAREVLNEEFFKNNKLVFNWCL